MLWGSKPQPGYKLVAENAGNQQGVKSKPARCTRPLAGANPKSKIKADTCPSECKTPEAYAATGDALILLRYQV